MADRKVALVTGAGKRRVGWHVARALGERGYALGIHYRNSALEATETVAQFRREGWEVESFPADLANEAAVRAMVEAVVKRFGRIDVLATCAAAWKPKRLEDVTANDVRNYFDVNTLSTFLCCQHFGLAMARQPEGGAIVTIGDWATERPYLDYAAYFPSKGAIPTLTRVMAVELGTRNPNVRVNCILPGPVMLPPDLPQVEREGAIRATLVQREGSPANIALAVLHFVENDFVTGACLAVDGGRTVFAPDVGR